MCGRLPRIDSPVTSIRMERFTSRPEHRLGDARVGDQVMPVGDRQLVDDDGQTYAGAIVSHAHEAVGGLAVDRGEAPVVEQ